MQVSPVKYCQGSLSVKALLLKDNSSVAKVCLFNKNAEQKFQPGDTIKVTSVFPKIWLHRKQLTSCPASSCEVY